jgi:hypothetical protein
MRLGPVLLGLCVDLHWHGVLCLEDEVENVKL